MSLALDSLIIKCLHGSFWVCSVWSLLSFENVYSHVFQKSGKYFQALCLLSLSPLWTSHCVHQLCPAPSKTATLGSSLVWRLFSLFLRPGSFLMALLFTGLASSFCLFNFALEPCQYIFQFISRTAFWVYIMGFFLYWHLDSAHIVFFLLSHTLFSLYTLLR